MIARRHHHISQCYLKGFVRDREAPKLYVVDGETRRTFRTSPANVGAERDFHSVEADGLKLDAVEKEFAVFETDLDQALRRINVARTIQDAKDRSLLFQFVTMLAVKNPSLRGNFRSALTQAMKITMDMATATPERWASVTAGAKRDGFLKDDADTDYRKMRDFLERGEYDIETATAMHLRIEMEAALKCLPLVEQRRWTLFRAEPGKTGFVTSDHPINLMWCDPNERGRYPVGLALRRTQLLFPISNELAIVGAFETDEMIIDADDDLVAELNSAIIAGARRQLYARDGDFLYTFARGKTPKRGSELLTDPIFRKS